MRIDKLTEQILEITNNSNYGWIDLDSSDETLKLFEEIIVKVKEADSEVENGIYDPMLECVKHVLNNYKIERR